MEKYARPMTPNEIAYPRGARVRVSDEVAFGEGVVVIPVVTFYENSLVGVEFDDAPGFVWQVRRNVVELL